MDETKSDLPEVSIGFPVYNGELFLKKALDALLNQTFSNFELIISDNNSTDSTTRICQEYAKNDDRIRYIKQEQNIGAYPNFYFVLTQAKGKYFMWAAADDFWEPDFILKNLKILSSNSNVVCSISKLDTFTLADDLIHKEKIKTVQYPSIVKNFVNKRRQKMIKVTFPVYGKFEKKIRKFLMNTGSNSRFYGLYRTSQIKECFIKKPFIASENAIFLNLLRLGDLYEIDEVLFHRFESGWSTYGIINMAKNVHGNFLGILFPYYPFNSWCLKNIGIKNILRNIDIFARMNLGGVFFLLVDLVLKFRK